MELRLLDRHLERAVSQYRRRLIAFFRRVCGHEEAEDFAQEVLCRYWSLSDPMGVRQPSAYIFGIAGKLLKDEIRRKAIRRAHASVHQSFCDAAASIDPERILAGRQTLNIVHSTLRQMPERTRQIFVLYRIEGMRQKDIASLLDISISSVEKHLVKASVLLAKRIGDR